MQVPLFSFVTLSVKPCGFASNGLRLPASTSCLGRHSCFAGRCPNSFSLHPPLAVVVAVAPEGRAFCAEEERLYLFGEEYTLQKL